MISDRAIRSAAERFCLADTAGADATVTEFEITLDASLSMTSGDGAKEELSRALCILLLRLAESAGWPARLVAVKGGGRDRTIDATDAGRIALLAFDGVEPLSDAIQQLSTAADRAAVRVVVSDFLVEAPEAIVEYLAARSGRLWLVQVLDELDRNPQVGGHLVLQDLETDRTLEVVLDEETVQGYLGRLQKLCESLVAASRAAGATLVTAAPAGGLEQVCEKSLVPAGLLHAIDKT